MSHHCHAIGCDKPTRPEMLMCRTHWTMVPRDLQDDVYEQYRRGQCNDRRPSKSWLLAAARARREVARLEGRSGAVEYLSSVIANLYGMVEPKTLEERRNGRRGEKR